MLGNLSEDIAQDDAFLDGGDLFGLALDSPQTSIPVNLVKKLALPRFQAQAR